MWTFDLAQTKAGQELIALYREKYEKVGKKRGERIGKRIGKKIFIRREIDRIQDLYSKGLLTDSLYKELLEPLQSKLAMLESVVIPDAPHEETGASAVS